MNPVTTLAMELSKVNAILEIRLDSLNDRINKNERGILMTSKDIKPLFDIMESINTVLKLSLPDVESSVSDVIIGKAYTEGKLDQLLHIVKLCYNDYEQHGRNDAIDAIGNRMRSIGYTPPV